METTHFNNLSPLEEKALRVWNSLNSDDEFQRTLACDSLEKAITLGGADLTAQQHYSLLGSALFYLLSTKEPTQLPYSLRSQMILFAAHYCLLRYIRDTETGIIENSPSEYAGALKRAYVCSKIFNDHLFFEVYSLINHDQFVGDRIIDSLYCRLQNANVHVKCDQITETLYLMQCVKQDTSIIYDYDAKEEQFINEIIDKALQKYYKYILSDVRDKIRDDMLF